LIVVSSPIGDDVIVAAKRAGSVIQVTTGSGAVYNLKKGAFARQWSKAMADHVMRYNEWRLDDSNPVRKLHKYHSIGNEGMAFEYLVEWRYPNDCTDEDMYTWVSVADMKCDDLIATTRFIRLGIDDREKNQYVWAFNGCTPRNAPIGARADRDPSLAQDTGIFRRDSDCLVYCCEVAVRQVFGRSLTPADVQYLQDNIVVGTTTGVANRPSRLAELTRKFDITMTREAVANRNVDFLVAEQTTGLFLALVAPSRDVPASHAIVVDCSDDGKVYDLDPRYTSIRECSDVVFDIWRLQSLRKRYQKVRDQKVRKRLRLEGSDNSHKERLN